MQRIPSLSRRRVLGAVAATLACAPFAALAQKFPDKPIRMLLPYGAGGIGDLTARVIAQKMGDNMGQQIVIDNRPSAGGVQAFTGALQAPADGYTLAMGGNGTAISQSLMKSLPYNILADFTQVSTMSRFALAILTGPDSKLRTLGDVIAYGKANPGKLNLGTSNIGSSQNLAAEWFKSVAGIEGQVVPFKVASGLYTALKAGDIDLAFEFIPPVLPQIKGGNARAIAVAGEKRSAALPDVPTTAEAGLKGYEVISWNAVSVKAGTPRPIVERLNQEFARAINSPDVVQKLREMNSEPYPLSPEQTRELFVREIAKWKGVIEHAKIPKT